MKKMNEVLALARANGGTLVRIPPGYWVYPGFKLRAGHEPAPAIRDRTIRAMVGRLALDWVSPTMVKLRHYRKSALYASVALNISKPQADDHDGRDRRHRGIAPADRSAPGDFQEIEAR